VVCRPAGGKIARSLNVKARRRSTCRWRLITPCGQRRPSGEREARLQWASIISAFKGDFDGFCDGLRKKGVTFGLEPTDFNPTTRIAFIDAPDGVSVELLNRKDQL
jgi:hypothetical protein